MPKLIQTEKSFLDTVFFTDIDLIEKCVKSIDKKLIEKPKIIVYGKECYQNRNVGFFSDDSNGYKYSGQFAKSIELSDSLKLLLNTINNLFSSKFNGILINKYIDGTNYIGSHSDDEKNLDDCGVVALSYGAPRKFRIRDKITKKIVKDLTAESGSIIHMGGEFQKEFTHEIPIEKKIKQARYSFTFRKHIKTG